MKNLTIEQETRLFELLNRTSKDWSEISKETIKIEVLDDTAIWCKCSELAAYRILLKYTHNKQLPEDLEIAYNKIFDSWTIIKNMEIKKYL